MCCPLSGIHRHQIHLISYGSVSFCLISIGLLFSVFAIFQKDSIIGKVWLAGPTTIVVGLVLLGKVVIDWGPAMNSKHFNSMDFYAVNSTQNYNVCSINIIYCLIIS
ncbi:unnamed protein product [Dracunculus medinensis]|uniref:Transmembrane protein 144 n=1 Tax=Dracunculus medinensis TaxID=318479 RepID=A0A0N4ULU8_DRAME|nr:unnamed protein product [Dracunculus medinensis]